MLQKVYITRFMMIIIVFSLVGCTTNKSETINQSITMTKGTEINLYQSLQTTKAPKETIEITELKSSNTDVVVISDKETIKSIKSGKSEITFFTDGTKYKIDATVVEPVHDLLMADEILMIELESKKINVIINSFGVMCSPQTLNIKIKYHSSNPEIVDIDDDGMLTAKKTGNANITVQAEGSTTITKECRVTVVN